jgi:hypothetical protein
LEQDFFGATNRPLRSIGQIGVRNFDRFHRPGGRGLILSLVSRSAIEVDLSRIKVALPVMSNVEFDALSKATYKAEQVAHGLLAWLDSACVWRLQRRNGHHYELKPPEAAIARGAVKHRCRDHARGIP